MQYFQCAIIGGGLGGLTLAIQLAQKGYQVVLFEKENYPYHKVCGEYVSMESWNYLERCGVPLTAFNLPTLTQLKISAPNGQYLTHTLKPGGFGISRYKLDYSLAQLAIGSGVKVIENCKVNEVTFTDNAYQIETSNGSFISEVLIGAYGKRSNIDIKLQRNFINNKLQGLNNYVGVKYHVKADLPANIIELHNFENGYCGISKIEDDRYCLCYLTNAANLKKYNGSIAEMEKGILMKNPFLHRYLTEFKSFYDKPLVISQISFAAKTQSENGVLMLGDAAGLITPLCGNGMSMAMHASYMLSKLLPLYFEKKITKHALTNEYTKQWNQQFKSRLWFGRQFQLLFGNKIMTNMVISALKPMPFVVNKLVSLTHGKPY
ncbi:MAG: NAD(P)/FAD-dependent oxidoreductase [Bacteroidota bacterium]